MSVGPGWQGTCVQAGGRSSGSSDRGQEHTCALRQAQRHHDRNIVSGGLVCDNANNLPFLHLERWLCVCNSNSLAGREWPSLERSLEDWASRRSATHISMVALFEVVLLVLLVLLVAEPLFWSWLKVQPEFS